MAYYKKTLKKLANFRQETPGLTGDDDKDIKEMRRVKLLKYIAKWRATPKGKASIKRDNEKNNAKRKDATAARRRDRGACHAAGIPYELDKRFYVYGYYLAGATLPIYIGKGQGDRDRRHLTPNHLKMTDPFHTELRRLKKLGIEVEILRLFKELSEQEALAKEEALIEHFGIRPEGILYNSKASGVRGSGAGAGKTYWCQGKKLTIAQMVLLPGCELTEAGLYGRLEISDKYETVEDAVFSQLVIGRQGKEYLFFGEMKTIPAIADDSRCKVSSGTIYAREKREILQASKKPRQPC